MLLSKPKKVLAQEAWIVVRGESLIPALSHGDVYDDPTIAESESAWKPGSRVVHVLVTPLNGRRRKR
jgi:hypothetical protein